MLEKYHNYIIDLVDSALSADYTRLRRLGNKIAKILADEDIEASNRLRLALRQKGVPLRTSGYGESLPVDGKSRLPLVEEQEWPTTPVFINASNENIIKDFLEDVKNLDLLSEKGISARLCLLLSGPPGTGKSLLASHIAAQLNKSFYVVRLDSAVSSLLGDTAKNIRSIFDFVPLHGGVLFIDEMDAVAKLRNDQYELGELKRVVNTVIQALDSLDDSAIVIAATNHSQLLDPAIWRRFPYKIEMGLPTDEVRKDIWNYYLFEDKDQSSLSSLLSKISDGMSGADIQTIALSARRHSILENEAVDIAGVVWAVLQTVDNKLVLPDRNGVTGEQKKKMSIFLAKKSINQTDIARLVSVSRQSVSAYLKEE
ncbi:AAA family ATPase [Zymomonas mobilis]|uniref:AAA family ATPase n=1 Tax=Zymomonas mobilis TaxID=542 RepID=UPI0021C2A533|nr:ATP-binding protein [Zymomonas mobilis]